MSTVVITITDTPDESINVNVKFDPPIKTAKEATYAQMVAIKMLNVAKQFDDDGEDV